MTQVRAIHHVESGVTGAEGIDGLALRYGFFYGPGTGLAEDGSIVGLVRKRRFPIIGGGAGGVVLPARGRRRLRDACSDRARHPACTTSLTMSPPGRLAAGARGGARRAPPPARVARRLAAGESVVYLQNRIRGLSNAR